MLLHTVSSFYDVFPFSPVNCVSVPIDNGVIYNTDGKFSGIFSTNPLDYLKIPDFQNGGLIRANNQQEKINKIY